MNNQEKYRVTTSQSEPTDGEAHDVKYMGLDAEGFKKLDQLYNVPGMMNPLEVLRLYREHLVFVR